jgi:hypothetical protein
MLHDSTLAARSAVLTGMGARAGAEWFTWPTVSAVLDHEHMVVLIATDAEPSPDDWDAVCLLLHLSGFHNGSDGPFTSDPGEPAQSGDTNTWQLQLSA